MREVPFVAMPVPIPEQDELLAVIAPSMIVRFTTVECPE
jgi:hypothetical protein